MIVVLEITTTIQKICYNIFNVMIYYRILYFVTLFFISGFSYTQNYGINLPTIDNNHDLHYGSLQSLYITKDGTLIFEKDTLSFSELKYRLYVTPYIKSPLNSATIYASRYVQLFADADVPYKFVDSVKTEIAGVEGRNSIIYRTNFSEKFNQKGIQYWLNTSFFKLKPKERLLTRKQLKKKDSLGKIEREYTSKFPDAPYDWKAFKPYSVAEAIYSLQPRIIKDVLEDKSYQCIRITNNGLNLNNNIIVKINKQNLESYLKKNTVLLIYTDKELLYKTYLKYLSTLHELIPYNSIKNKNYGIVIEVSNQMQWLHKISRVTLCE